MPAANKTFIEATRDYVDFVMHNVRVAMPAVVQNYDPVTQTAQVQPLIKDVFVDAEGNELVTSMPVVYSAPVAWPRAGGYFITLPLQPGDTVLLLCTDQSLDTWRSSGVESDPGDLRVHTLAGAVVYPGLYPDTKPMAASDVSTTGLALGKEGGPNVHCTPDGVELGGSIAVPPTDFVALASLVETELGKIQAAIASLGGAYSPLSVTATKVKAI